MDTANVLISQYLASLKMLEQAIVECPDSLWNADGDKNKFWEIAYHAVYFVHEYLADSYDAFTFWGKHRPGYEDFAPLERREPYDKETVLEYLAFCRQHVAERVPQLDLAAAEGHGREFTVLELQIYSIRHLMQHVGELGERLGAQAGIEIDWVGRQHG